jgi:hypothetical protein
MRTTILSTSAKYNRIRSTQPSSPDLVIIVPLIAHHSPLYSQLKLGKRENHEHGGEKQHGEEGMSCRGDRNWSYAFLQRADFDACLDIRYMAMSPSFYRVLVFPFESSSFMA